MFSEPIFSELVSQIYEAAMDSEKWKGFLERGAQLFKAHIATIHFQDTASSECGFTIALNADDSCQKSYRERYAAISPYMKCTDIQQQGRTYVRRELIDTSSLIKTEFYNDWAKPLDFFDYVCGTMLRDGPVVGNITFWRSERTPPCDREEVQLLDSLMPHLVRALQIHRKIAGVERKCEAIVTALDMIHRPLILLDQSGKVSIMNRAATALVERNDGLCIFRNQIEAYMAADASAIRRAVQCALNCAHGKAAPVSGILAVARKSGRRSFLLWVAPLLPWSLMDNANPMAAVFIIDPESEPDSPERLLRRVFGLTAAEARLAAVLLRGDDLNHAANEFGVSRNTVRSQLRAIFSKTNASRQSELVRLLVQVASTINIHPISQQDAA